eukprot:403346115
MQNVIYQTMRVENETAKQYQVKISSNCQKVATTPETMYKTIEEDLSKFQKLIEYIKILYPLYPCKNSNNFQISQDSGQLHTFDITSESLLSDFLQTFTFTFQDNESTIFNFYYDQCPEPFYKYQMNYIDCKVNPNISPVPSVVDTYFLRQETVYAFHTSQKYSVPYLGCFNMNMYKFSVIIKKDGVILPSFPSKITYKWVGQLVILDGLNDFTYLGGYQLQFTYENFDPTLIYTHFLQIVNIQDVKIVLNTFADNITLNYNHVCNTCLASNYKLYDLTANSYFSESWYQINTTTKQITIQFDPTQLLFEPRILELKYNTLSNERFNITVINCCQYYSTKTLDLKKYIGVDQNPEVMMQLTKINDTTKSADCDISQYYVGQGTNVFYTVQKDQASSSYNLTNLINYPTIDQEQQGVYFYSDKCKNPLLSYMTVFINGIDCSLSINQLKIEENYTYAIGDPGFEIDISSYFQITNSDCEGVNQNTLTITAARYHTCDACQQPFTYELRDLNSNQIATSTYLNSSNIMIINFYIEGASIFKYNNIVNDYGSRKIGFPQPDIYFPMYKVEHDTSNLTTYCMPVKVFAHMDTIKISGPVASVVGQIIPNITINTTDGSKASLNLKSYTCDGPFDRYWVNYIDCNVLDNRIQVQEPEIKRFPHYLGQDSQTYTFSSFKASNSTYLPCLSGLYKYYLTKFDIDQQKFMNFSVAMNFLSFNQSTLTITLSKTTDKSSIGAYEFILYNEKLNPTIYQVKIQFQVINIQDCITNYTYNYCEAVKLFPIPPKQLDFTSQNYLCQYVSELSIIAPYNQTGFNDSFNLEISPGNILVQSCDYEAMNPFVLEIYLPQQPDIKYQWEIKLVGTPPCLTFYSKTTDSITTNNLIKPQKSTLKHLDFPISNGYLTIKFEKKIRFSDSIYMNMFRSRGIQLKYFQSLKNDEYEVQIQSWNISSLSDEQMIIKIVFNNTQKVSYYANDRVSLRIVNQIFFVSEDFQSILGPDLFIYGSVPPQYKSSCTIQLNYKLLNYSNNIKIGLLVIILILLVVVAILILVGILISKKVPIVQKAVNKLSQKIMFNPILKAFMKGYLQICMACLIPIFYFWDLSRDYSLFFSYKIITKQKKTQTLRKDIVFYMMTSRKILNLNT